jgi:uncharacterized LabA/DUF88 family protein
LQLDDTLVFVDGENLTLRYQELLRAGRTPAKGNIHVPDAFIWNQSILDTHFWKLKRVSYYTSVTGDELKLREVRNLIGGTTFTCKTGIVNTGRMSTPSTRTGQIMPFVRKKAARTRKESICDIQIAVDVLRACYRDHAKTIWIFTGDGDFISLFEEIVHSGKTVYVSALSSGLSDDIPFAVDEFLPLDDHFFEPASPEPENTAPPEPPAADA